MTVSDKPAPGQRWIRNTSDMSEERLVVEVTDDHIGYRCGRYFTGAVHHATPTQWEEWVNPPRARLAERE